MNRRTPSPRRRRSVGLAVALLVLLSAGCGDDDRPEPTGPATVTAARDQVTEVTAGDEVVIDLEESPGVGDSWRVAEEPDRAVLRLVDDTYEADDPDLIGGGGRHRFTFTAVGPGTTTVEMHNCYRCDSEGRTPPEDAAEAVDVTYEIRVR